MSSVLGDDGKPPHDPKGRLNCGLEILQIGRQTDPGIWAGKIYNPDDGSDWNCEVWVEGNTLRLRGYVVTPLLGKTQVWHHFTGHVGADCSMRA